MMPVMPVMPSRKVLLVDDSMTVRLVLRTYLMGRGAEFIAESDGIAALRTVLRERPDVVITDIEMPNMSGLELCEAIRSAPGLSDVQLVLISSKWTEARRRAARRLGVRLCLEKPIDPAALAQVLD
jgi:two-component system chemotaxis response regulator CheY